MSSEYALRMAALEDEFRAVSGLSDRGHYRVFYSHVHRCPLLVLGYNPGGQPGDPGLFTASDSYFENWEHDFVEFRFERRYAVAAPAFEMLCVALNTRDESLIRQVPVSNVIFRRSPNMDKMASRLARESAPVLSQIIQIVQPRIVLTMTKVAYEQFLTLHCQGDFAHCSDPVRTPNGASPAVVYTHCSAALKATGEQATIICTGHPSKYSSRREWPHVLERVRQAFEANGVTAAAFKCRTDSATATTSCPH